MHPSTSALSRASSTADADGGERGGDRRKSRQRWTSIGLIGLLWGFIAIGAVKEGQHVLEFSRFSDLEAPNPVPSATSPTGYQEGLRWIDLGDNLDAYYWIMQAQAMDAGRGLRQRWVPYDNAPSGRENHWALPHRLWLGALGYAIHLIQGVPLGIGIERTALCDGPILLASLGALLIWLAARFYSISAACVVTFALIGSETLADYFSGGDTDHHGMIAATLLLMLACTDLGRRRLLGEATGNDAAEASPSGGVAVDKSRGGTENVAASRWMIVAGIFGAIGMWLSAASLVPAIAAVGVGAALSRFRGTTGQNRVAHARAWRAWGIAGSVTAFVCYLVEYFPNHMELRLEVNHPAYALAWWGGAEVVALIWEWGEEGDRINRRRVLRWAVAIAALGFFPVLFLLTRQASFLAGDPIHLGIAEHFIIEGQSFWNYTAMIGFEWPVVLGAAGWLFPLVLTGWCFTSRAPRATVVRILPIAVTAVAIGALGMFQVRWLGLMQAANLWLLVAWLDTRSNAAPARRRWQAALAVGILLPGCVHAGVALARPNPGFGNEDIWRLADRSLAYRLRERMGDAPATVLCAPDMTAWFAYYAGLRGLGSFYWENVPGLHKAADIYSAPTMEEAHRLIKRWGITQIVVVSWDAFEPLYVKLLRKLPKEAAVPEDCFIFQLVQRGQIPSWLRRVPYQLPDHPAFKNQNVLIYDVVADQPSDLQLANQVEAMTDSGEKAQAQVQIPQLQAMRRSIPVLLALHKVLGPDRASELAPQLKELEAGVHDLRLEDRINLAVVYAEVGWLDDAKEELARTYDSPAESDVRRLSPTTLDVWMRLGDALKMPMKDAQLAELVRSLIPPYLR